MKKKDKLIGLTKDTKRKLTIMGAKEDKKLKPFCEDILAAAANSDVVVDGVLNEETNAGLRATMRESGSIELKKVDEAPLAEDRKGKFDRIEANIYSNGKCFQVRKMTEGGMVEEYFVDIDVARGSLGKK